MTFGKIIRFYREKKEITLRSMAEKIGITPSYLSDIEKDRRYPPKFEKLELIAEIFQLNDAQKESMYDILALQYNRCPDDLLNYINENSKLRSAIRFARDNNIGNNAWGDILDEWR